MKKTVNIAVIGLGQIGNYLLNELNKKQKDIKLLTGKNIRLVAPERIRENIWLADSLSWWRILGPVAGVKGMEETNLG